MLVVDTFTKLIFELDSDFTPVELSVIQAFRLVDENVVMDSHSDMGAYLRALGVEEMVGLVDQVCRKLASEGAVNPCDKTASGTGGRWRKAPRRPQLH